jgi:hypothetical protein
LTRACAPATLLAAATLILAPGAAVRASAQSSQPRVVIGVNGGVQSPPPAVSDRFDFESSVETATVAVSYPAKSAVLVDAGVGIRLWQHVGTGLAVSHATSSGSAEIDARIPHPLLFDQPRTVPGSQAGIDRTETAVHVQLLYAIDVNPRLTVTLSGGPSFVRIEQALVTDVKYDESYPFDEATFRSAGTRRAKASAAGFNAGADVRWMFARSYGAGALVRYSRATVDLDTPANQPLSVRGGGVQAGIGLRIVF